MLSPSRMTLSLYSTGSLLKPHSPACVPGRTSQSCLPVGQVVRGHDDVVADAEGDVDPLAVGGRRAGGVAVFLVERLQRPLHDGLLPEDLSGGAVEAQEHALLGGGQAGDGADAIAPDDGRGMALAGDLGLPERAGSGPSSWGRSAPCRCRRRAGRASRARTRLGPWSRRCRGDLRTERSKQGVVLGYSWLQHTAAPS